MAAEKKRIGRPPLPKGEKRSETVMLRLRPADHREIQRLAEKRNMDVAALVRLLVLDALDLNARS